MKKRAPAKITGKDLKASSIGWEIALPIVSGPVIGYFLDKKFQTSPKCTLILLGIGLASACVNLIRFIVEEYALIRSNEEEKKKND